jgi:homocysteine S-methyltransferase
MAARDPFAVFRGPIVVDGGLATELERRGADLRDPLWSAKVLLEEPDRILDVHRAYVEAGADVLIGASYQASFEGFARRGIDRAAASTLLARSVELARRAADEVDRPMVVAASVGPYGAILANGAEYTGGYRLGERSAALGALRDFHGPRAAVLAAAAPDLLAAETIPSIDEAEALISVLDEVGLPAWMSFSCRDATHLNDGTRLADAVDVVRSCSSLVAIGVNCTPPTFVAPLLQIAGSMGSTPLVAYPNRGATWDAAAKAWVGDAVPAGFGPLAIALRDAGAALVGGCCGTGPADIRDITTALSPAA